MNKQGNKPPASVYLATVIVVFFSTLSAADSIGFVPYYIDGTDPSSSQTAAAAISIADLPQLGETSADATTPSPVTPNSASAAAVTKPVRIQISKIGLDLPVQNPATRNIDVLDQLLQQGPARYVDSAKLGEDGNVIIFAHSSHLPVVHNLMFRAFNKIPDLVVGDTITLSGENGVDYLYSVNSVRKTDSSDTIALHADGQKLTLVTCDTLTGKSARFVLDATFIGTAN